MRKRKIFAALAVLAACGGGARTLRYDVITVGRHAGDAELTIARDGSRTSHFTFNDRGRGPDITTHLVLDADGAVRELHATGHDYLKAPVDEKVETRGGERVWASTSEHGHGAGFYVPQAGPVDSSAVLARALQRAPDHELALLPAGKAWIEDQSTLDVTIDGKPRRLTRVAIAGLGYAPFLVWLDERGDYFAEVSVWSSIIARGADALIPKLVAADQAWHSARAAKLAATLARTPPAAGLAITHARLFDSEARALRDDVTVIIAGDRVTAVGPAATTPPPAGAEIIDAHGRTIIPGLWDMHVHLGDEDGAFHLGAGVTTVRDLGNDIDDLAARMKRYDDGTEVGPRLLRAGLIDGPGEFAAPTGILVATEDEARAAVARFAGLGYQQIKLYSSLDPKLVPGIVADAHARGLRVSGHIPNGMRAEDAVRAGFDELQHSNFLFLNFLARPGDDTRTPLRFTRVAEDAAGLDLGSDVVRAFVDLLVEHHTVVDPTLATFEGMFVSDPGELDPQLAPLAARLPAQVLRGASGGGLPAPGAKRATFRASYAQMKRMVRLLFDRGVTIVAGTDATPGIALDRELELYVDAGIPSADVLALATIGAARVMKRDAELGSVAVGKRADLVLLDGDPVADISAVRRPDVVICRGIVYDPSALWKAVGIRPR